ncbi:hypothetical protein THIOSC15_1660002 [uncultured Thiomicrorhabdus sp.]
MSIYSQFDDVNPNAKDRSNQLQAAITREQYDDYNDRFSQYLTTLTDQVSNEQVAADKSKWNSIFQGQANTQADKANEMTNLNLSRFGLTQNARESESNKRLAGLTASSNAVGNMNNMNQSIDDRVTALLSGQNLSDQRG